MGVGTAGESPWPTDPCPAKSRPGQSDTPGIECEWRLDQLAEAENVSVLEEEVPLFFKEQRKPGQVDY